MSNGRVDEFAKWIREGLRLPGKNRQGLADALGIHKTQISHIAAGRRRIKADQIPVIVAYLGTPPPFSDVKYAEPQYPIGETTALPLYAGSVTMVPVVGLAAPGRWMEADLIDEVNNPPSVSAVVTEYKGLRQFAYLAVGKSMELARIFDGDSVVCVSFDEAREAPTDGDIVVVERRRGGLIERSIKSVSVTPTAYRLEPRSAEPGHKTITVPRRGPWVEGDGTEVAIVGLCVWAGRGL